MANSSNKAAVARRVWGRMFGFLMRTAPERTSSLARRGLTPNDSRALASLDPEKGRTMRSLADEWQCDASNATWIVDRLERMHLAERRSIPRDRRVKLVVLTPKGAKTKAELMEDFLTPPAELLALDRADLDALDRATEKLPSSDASTEAAARTGRGGSSRPTRRPP
jgi:DNA-binding MarR family transcriptional regulator